MRRGVPATLVYKHVSSKTRTRSYTHSSSSSSKSAHTVGAKRKDFGRRDFPSYSSSPPMGFFVVVFVAVIGWYFVNLDQQIDEDWVTFEESGLKNSSEYKELAALAFQGDENITKADFVETVKGGYTFCVVAASVRYAKYTF